MAVTSTWFDDEKTIIIHHFEGQWMLPDYYQSLRDTDKLLQTVDYKVTHFLDMTQARGLPKNLLFALRSSPKSWYPNSECTVMIGANSHILAFSKIFNELFPDPDTCFFIVNSIEEALDIIGQPA